MAAYVAVVKEFVNGVRIASSSNVRKIREESSDKLFAAINATDQITREASSEPAKGSGSIAPKAHSYHILAYLVQLLDAL